MGGRTEGVHTPQRHHPTETGHGGRRQERARPPLLPRTPETASFDVLGPIEAAIARQRRTLCSARAALAEFEGLYADAHRLEPSALTRLSDEPHRALRIQHPALVRFLARNFDEAWARAVPVRPERVPLRTPVVTSDLQRTILQAVVGGEADESIARRLGMSRRSVAEHVRRVSEQLGSDSRAQLGYLVATSGLLSGLLEA
ncbi:LuxR C-terminal-related transcriptional regulator [Streptomyces sp. NPDC058357]|uniref:LuxR C-terminal-related transcriptional regulator n=1 Tax=unclassified Streptomyces TaxID=2593676 RepID=UPI0036495B4F